MESSLAARVLGAEGRTSMNDRADDWVVDLRDVSLQFGEHLVLDGLGLRVERGELLALLGPSGSGKTTVIRTIAGFLNPSGGSVWLAGRDVTGVRPHKRGVGVVFQSYALFPHMTVAENLAYPLKVRKWGRQQIRSRCEELLALVRLEGHENNRPSRLSGGQQQRVALARALAMEPEVLLLDEPLSNLDANLRRDVGSEIRRLQKSTGTTAIMVTHDRQEAFGMADRIAVLNDGRVEQLGTPRELYRTPASRFMATFVGDANLLAGKVVDGQPEAGYVEVTTPLGQLHARGRAKLGDEVDILIRPEDLVVSASPTAPRSIVGEMIETAYFGDSVVARISVAGLTLTALTSGSSSAEPPATGQRVYASVDRANCVVVPVPGT